VEVVVHAGGLGARGLDQAVENLEKLRPLFRPGVKTGDQGTSRRFDLTLLAPWR
jgi:hypothetical protein